MRTLSLILLVAFLTGAAGLGAKGQALRTASETPPMDCTFTIKGNFNGTVVDLQVTVSDVTFIECTLLKIGVKKALK